jgi:uncharacterized protein YidB (DUF937 family)
MTALLGLLAIAGYQNRDKIIKMLGDLGKPGAAEQGGIGGLLSQLRNNLGETGPGRVLIDGLGELVDRFKQSGYGETVESWVGTGPNRFMTPAQLEQAIGPEVLDNLSNKRVYRKTICLADCLARFPTLSIPTRRKADSPLKLPKPSFDLPTLTDQSEGQAPIMRAKRST